MPKQPFSVVRHQTKQIPPALLSKCCSTPRTLQNQGKSGARLLAEYISHHIAKTAKKEAIEYVAVYIKLRGSGGLGLRKKKKQIDTLKKQIEVFRN